MTIIDNANSAIVSSGGTDAPSPGTVEEFTVTTAADFAILSGQQTMPIIDLADLNKTAGYEIMYVTANANGTDVNWTVTRGAEMTDGAVVYAHQPNWIAVPVLTSGTLPSNGGGVASGMVPPVVVVSTGGSEVTTSPPSGGATIDGASVISDWRVLLTSQSTFPDNGIWIVNTAGSWTRPSDWSTGSLQKDGMLVPVGEDNGDNYWSSIWELESDTIIDTDPAQFQLMFSLPVMQFDPAFGSPPTITYPNGFLVSGGILNVLAQLIVGGPLKFQGAIFSTSGILTSNTVLNVLGAGAVAPMDLPAAVGGANVIMVKNISGSSIVITPNGGDTIDGIGGGTSLSNLGSWILQSDGVSNWYILASH